MREVSVKKISEVIEKMCIEANIFLSKDIKEKLMSSITTEESAIGKQVLSDIVDNFKIAEESNMPICQDTGMTVVFMNIGQDVHFIDGNLEEAINLGIKNGYEKGYLRKSVVNDPILRVNTRDNTPGVIHYHIVPGDQVEIIIAPKGFGSENMSRMKMLKPSDGKKGIVDFVLETVSLAGPNPCPPIVVGVGIGGTVEKASFLAKKSLLRDVNEGSKLDHIRELEKELLEKVNNLGIGPQGLGGRTTAIGVNIETYPTHIAGLPVVVNINCHASRHVREVL